MIQRASIVAFLCLVCTACGAESDASDDGGAASPGSEAVGPAAGAPGLAGPAAVPVTPDASLVMLVLDTLRADHMSVYGYERPTTPFLEELAASSIVFERAYAPASWTRASTASLLTARIPESHGCEDRDGQLAEEVTTLAELLREQGFATRGVIANGNVIDKWGFGQGFDSYEFVKDRPHAYAKADAVDPHVRETLDDLGAVSRYFLYLHYVDPHDPYFTDAGRYNPGYEGALDGSRDSLKAFNSARPPEPEYAQVLALYDAEITYLDAYLRGLFEDLDARGVLDDAWVVITSDHGEGLWDHRTRAHGGEIFDEQLHVPLIVRPPGGLGARVDVGDRISLIDVAPTLVDWLGVDPIDDFEGRSWRPHLAAGEPAPVRPIIIDVQLDDFDMKAVIDGDDKLLVDRSRQQILMFDLGEDPREQRATAVKRFDALPPRGRELNRILNEAIAEAYTRRPSDTRADLDEVLDAEMIEHLKALGYMGDETEDPEDG